MEGTLIKREGQVRWKTAQSWLKRGESCGKTGEIGGSSTVAQVKVFGHKGNTLKHRTHTAYNDKFNLCLGQPGDHLFEEVLHGRQPPSQNNANAHGDASVLWA